MMLGASPDAGSFECLIDEIKGEAMSHGDVRDRLQALFSKDGLASMA